jgi:hypothetical protein
LDAEILEAIDDESDSDDEFPDTQLGQIDSNVILGDIVNLTSSITMQNPIIDTKLQDIDKTGSVNTTQISQNRIVETTLLDVDKSKPLPRGKKGKLKKIKAKYGDQDEENRTLMIDLLASDKGPQPKGKKAKANAVKEMELQDRQKQWENKSDSAVVSQRPKRTSKPAINEIIKDEDVGNMAGLDLLIGLPLDADMLLHCVPVCAPWGALQKYKYKVKLIPGSLKRGKAAKSAENSFLNMISQDELGAREKECVKAIPEMEWLQTIMAKVKVVSNETSSSKKGKTR